MQKFLSKLIALMALMALVSEATAEIGVASSFTANPILASAGPNNALVRLIERIESGQDKDGRGLNLLCNMHYTVHNLAMVIGDILSRYAKNPSACKRYNPFQQTASSSAAAAFLMPMMSGTIKANRVDNWKSVKPVSFFQPKQKDVNSASEQTASRH